MLVPCSVIVWWWHHHHPCCAVICILLCYHLYPGVLSSVSCCAVICILLCYHPYPALLSSVSCSTVIYILLWCHLYPVAPLCSVLSCGMIRLLGPHVTCHMSYVRPASLHFRVFQETLWIQQMWNGLGNEQLVYNMYWPSFRGIALTHYVCD